MVALGGTGYDAPTDAAVDVQSCTLLLDISASWALYLALTLALRELSHIIIWTVPWHSSVTKLREKNQTLLRVISLVGKPHYLIVVHMFAV